MPQNRVVVGAAIVEVGRLLAARRTAPVDLAGGWELPGGKVDPGEQPEAALVREVYEELGCTVEVGERLHVDGEPGAEPLRPGLELHAYACRLVAGEPVPRERDAVRWLMPEELDEPAWLPADRPFVTAMHERLLDGEPLAGGNVGGAVRIGATVRRPTGLWTPAVHALLRHLDRAGLDGVPRPLGLDARGREVLSYLPGRAIDVDAEPPGDDVLAQAAAWLRRMHTAVARYRPEGPMRWRQVPAALGPDEIVCHHDPGAYNWLVCEDRFAGLVDWDMAGPGRPLDDLAFLVWSGVPLFRETPTDDVVRRLRLAAQAYGGVGAAELLPACLARMGQACERIAAGQRAGDPGMRNLATVGEPDRTARRLAGLRQRMPAIVAAFGG